jgi:hypothetical protein
MYNSNIVTPFDNINLTEHIRNQYKHIFALNLDEVKLIRHKTHERGNFFSEDYVDDDVEYIFIVNINPVKAKTFVIDEKIITTEASFEVYTDPQTYSKEGKTSSGLLVSEPLISLEKEDIIEYKGRRFRLDNLENVALNRKETLWEHFFMKLIN